ncbi:hypothetical protein Q1695_015080 [Nippostrongylus brasiliensis]|nr:hypothetical protein Q1695_015080 [Nippostrongylus brasiliensis]
MPVRPEMSRPGGKSQLKNVDLHTRAQLRKKQKAQKKMQPPKQRTRVSQERPQHKMHKKQRKVERTERQGRQIVDEVLSKLDIGEFHVKLNHRFVLEGMFTACDAGADQFKKICSFIMDKLDKKSWVGVFTATPSTSLRMS